MSGTELLSPAEAPPVRQGTVHKVFSFARVRAIASNTLLELVRLKVFYFLLIFALGVIGSSLLLIQFSFQEQFQVLKDVAMGAMSIFTWLLAILSTAMMLPKDVEDRTLYTILAKPVPRFEYLLGKLLGVLMLLLIAMALMSVLFVGVLYLQERWAIADAIRGTPAEDLPAALAAIRKAAFNVNLIPGLIVIYLKAAVCASFTLLVSTFASSWIFTIIVANVVYLIGHVQGIARDYWLEHTSASLGVKLFLMFVALIFPDFQLFSLVDDVAAGAAVPIALFAKTAGLGVVYVAVYLLAAYFMFADKEL